MSAEPTVSVEPTFDAEGANFRVNTSAAEDQRPASAAPLDGGGYVAVWIIDTNDSTTQRVMAQIFGADGIALGAAFEVAPGQDTWLREPSVARLDGGGFVVGWTTLVGAYDQVLAQRFDAAGHSVGDRITVATDAASYAPFPASLVDLAPLPDGGFLATWSHGATVPGEVMGRRYGADGTPLGAAFQVNTYIAEYQGRPDAAVFADGRFVVVWDSIGQDGDSGGIYGQMFSAAGAPVGSEFRVNTVAAGFQDRASVTALAGGGFAVTWHQPNIMTATTVKLQVYDPAGVAIGSEITIDSFYSAAPVSNPVVAGLPDGGLVVTWGRSHLDVRGQRFEADGSPLGTTFDISTTAPGETPSRENRAAIVTDNGELLAIWTSNIPNPNSGNDIDVFAQRYQVVPVATEQVALAVPNAITVGDDGVGSNPVSVTLSVDFGTLSVNTTGSGVSAGGNGSASVVLTGTVDQINALLAGGAASKLSYLADSDTPPPSATLTVEVRDGENQTASAAIPLAIGAVDDPAVARADAAATTEAASKSGNLFADNGSGADSDPDGPALSVSAVNGNAGAVGTTITLASGALLTVQANGDYLYNPNGQFDALPGPDSGASNLSATDSFTYTLANGSTATVTLTLTGVDSNDTLIGTAGSDALYGGDGDDILVTAHNTTGGEVFNGGPGLDTLELRPTSGSFGFHMFLSTTVLVEQVRFASVADSSLVALMWLNHPGSSQPTHVVGGDGADLLSFVVFPIGTTFVVPDLVLTNWASSSTPLTSGDLVSLQANGPENYTLVAREGLASTQSLLGGSGNDTLTGSSGSDILDGGVGTNVLNGNGGDDFLVISNFTFTGVPNTFTGAGSTFSGGAGTDTLQFGGAVYFQGTVSGIEALYLTPQNNFGPGVTSVTIAADTFADLPAALALAGSGSITVNLAPGDSYDAASFVVAAGSSITHVVNGSTANDTIAGLQGADTLYGNDGNDTLWGMGGTDTLIGGLGDDTFHVDSADDVVIEGAGEGGNDRVFTSVSYALGADVHVELLGTASDADTLAINLTGNELANQLRGNAGANVLDGGAGADTMAGLGGDDQFLVDDSFDQVVENAGEGTDIVLAVISHELAANVENLILTGGGNTSGAGNALANVLIGNAGDNWLAGLAGDDVLEGGLGADHLQGGTGNDWYYVDSAGEWVDELAGEGTDLVIASISYELAANAENLALGGTGNLNGAGNAQANRLTGNAGNNWLAGAQGDDVLEGGLGADHLQGGTGNDWYYVDNAGEWLDELAGEGTDWVLAAISYELAANVENLTLTGAGDTSGAGNALANLLTGNAGNNWLAGAQGDDVLDGGLGADHLQGGTGNDWYYVDNAGEWLDELPGEGTDQVLAAISYQLAANVENLTLAGGGNLNAAGNALANLITGSADSNWLAGLAGEDVLNGGLGADKMEGGTGNDTYHVDNAGDWVIENAGEGTDQVLASISYELAANVENLMLDGVGNLNGAGNALANVLTGTADNNWLAGLLGNDVLDGGLGADQLQGGADQDVFAFTTALGGGNVDWISDFAAADDTIQLDDAVFTGLANGALGADAFATGAAATEADDRIVYDGNTGALWFDADGLGGVAAVQFATLNAGLTLTSADFLVV